MKIFPSTFWDNSIEYYMQEISPKSQLILTSVLLFLTFCFISLPFLYVNTFSQARGIIKANKEKYRLTAPMAGELTCLNIRENKYVEKGDTLLIFDCTTIEKEINAKVNEITKTKNYINDLSKLTAINNEKKMNQLDLQMPLLLKEYYLFLEKVDEVNFNLKLLEKRFIRYGVLHKKQLISIEEYEKLKYEFDKSRSKKEQFIKMNKLKWEEKLNDYEIEFRLLNIEFEKLLHLKRRCIVLAPVNGTIQELKGIEPKSFLAQNQHIANISPDDSLIAEIYVTPQNIGFIKKGQHINIQIDAYNYREWGLLKGKILEISEDVVVINREYYFKVRCRISKDYLQLKNNFRGYLKKGMTFTANIIHNKRSLYNLLFDKINNIVNPKVG